MKTLFFILSVLLLLAGCRPKQQWKKDDIDKKEKALLDEAKGGRVDTGGVSKLLTAYQQYAQDFPTDTIGAEYLFKAADFCRYLHRPKESIHFYEKVYDNYPTLSKRPYALFLQGFIYENELKDIPSARVKYQQFIDKYPNDPFSRDVQITLNNLGKSPEELIHEFEQKQKGDSIAGK